MSHHHRCRVYDTEQDKETETSALMEPTFSWEEKSHKQVRETDRMLGESRSSRETTWEGGRARL